jgi:hypothetical protein
LPEATRAADTLLSIREHLFGIARDAYWPPTIDRDQTIRNLALAVIEELRMYEAQQSRRAN